MSVYVGIGASAGGLEALTQIVQNLPQKSGFVFIIAQHTNPNKPSALIKLLSEQSTLPVSEANQQCDFQPDHIYVIAPSYNLVYKDNHLALQKTKPASHHPTPNIDLMFEALALYKRDKAVAVVLTGMGRDGSKGIVSIKEHNGITIAQLPSTAKHPSMPQAAINTNMVDYQLSLKEIATHLRSIVSMQSTWQSGSNSPALREIANMLHSYKHLDIFKYKAQMIDRRINKRILMLNLKNLNEYALFLQHNPAEIELLYQEILIHVTSFFRDKEAFMRLKEQLEGYLQNKPDGYNLRIWSAGCSSGEEAYTLAILIDIISKELGKKIKPNIFATDIDDRALNKARRATYSQDEIKGVADSILKSYFTVDGGGYRIQDFIKEHITFAHHDILSDPPFIDQDLISLRNVLIYIQPDVQKEIFSLCYNALKDEGLLFLGLWEATLIDVKYFKSLDMDAKIYQKQILQNSPQIPMHYFDKQKKLKKEISLAQTNKDKLADIEKIVSDEMFDFFKPDFIIIDEDYSIIYKRGDMPFLKISDGFISLNILSNIHKELRYDLQNILQHASKEKTTQKTGFIEIKLDNGKRMLVRIIAFVFHPKGRNLNFLLYFEQIDINEIEFFMDESVKKDNTLICTNLHLKLQKAKEGYKALQQQSLLYKENMQLLNEELQSSNEELQSQAEELETSNEELKSSNEELQNLNTKLSAALQQNRQLQNDLALLLNSTQDAIIGLDINGNHTFVNDAAVSLLGFTKNELLGKNGHAMWHHTKADGSPYPLSECTVHQALKNGTTFIGKDLYWRKDGTPVPVSVIQTPIKQNGKTIGAVLAFHDISQQQILQRQLYEQENIYKITFDRIDIGIAHIGLDGVLIDSNPYLSRLLGYSQQELRHLSTADVTVAEDLDKEMEMIQQLLNKERKEYRIQKRFTTKSKKIIWMEVSGVIVYDDNGKPLYILKTYRDITKNKLLSLRLESNKKMLEDIINSVPIVIIIYNEEGKIIMINKEFENFCGCSSKEIATIEDLVSSAQLTQEQKKHMFDFYYSVFKNSDTASAQRTIPTKHGVIKTVISSITKLSVTDENGKQIAVLTNVDITDRLKNEEIMVSQSRQAAMGDMLSMIAHQWRQPLGVIAMSANNIHAMLDLGEKIEPKALKDFIKTIENQTQYLSKTVDDFREFFKPDTQKETVLLDTIFQKLNTLVDKALENNNITLTLPKQSGIKIKTYQNQLIQVLLNIVNNAKDAIKERNPSKRNITITLKTTKDKVNINICDSGGGIDNEVISKLTQPYVTTKGKNGTGLGLYMSEIIVTRHLGGTINWRNENDGACFEIELERESK